MMVH